MSQSPTKRSRTSRSPQKARVPIPPKATKPKDPYIAGQQERKKTQTMMGRASRCTQEVINSIGIYDIEDIYRYFIVNLGADRSVIDRDLARTKYIDDFVTTRTDMDNKAKLKIIELYRDQHLCRILNKLYRKYKLSGTNLRVDDFFREHIDQAIRDYLNHLEQEDLKDAGLPSTPPMPMDISEGGGKRRPRRKLIKH